MSNYLLCMLCILSILCIQFYYSYKIYVGKIKISSSISLSKTFQQWSRSMTFSTVSSTSLTKSLSSTSLLSSSTINNNNKENNNYNITNAGIVLLAGGKGKRMQSAVPKQFLSLLGKPVFLRSLDIFKFLDKNIISSIVIVLDESYREEYQYLLREDSRIVWANPGKERQDSVYNGIQAIPDSCSIVGKKIAYWID